MAVASNIVAVAVIGPDGKVINTVAHDGTPFKEGEYPPGWVEGVFPEGCTYLPIFDVPLPEPAEVGAAYDEATGTFSSVD